MFEHTNSGRPGLALKIGIVGVLGLGAVVSGLLLSRQGRRLVREAWQGRRRTRIEDRVLDALWGDPIVGRRNFDVEEHGEGGIELRGVVRSRRERARALRLARSVQGVSAVEDCLVLERPPHRRRPPHPRRARHREPVRIED